MLTPLLASLALLLGALAAPARAAESPPPVRHVFVVMLENRDFATTFGAGSQAPYLARTLTSKGELLPQYYGVTHESLGNYMALISGQGSNVITQADCPLYTDVFPGIPGGDGQAFGAGCVMPGSVKTIADQLEAKGLTWKGYMEDMAGNCQHPAPNSADMNQSATAASQYATRHNPFVYFHSLLDSGSCARNDVPYSRLATDLRSERTTPSFAFITPDLCHDAHDASCADGGPGGLPAADAFLRSLVPRILASPAYQDRGLLVITFDESASGSQACCGEPQFPNTPVNGGRRGGPGGGRVGAVLLSRYIRPGSVNQTAYNHFSLLRSFEDIFGLGHLGFAGRNGLRAFGDDVFNGPRCFSVPLPAPRRDHTFPRGILIAGAAARGRTLGLTLAHDASVRIVARSGRHSVRIGPRSGRACHSYAVRLPSGHGRLSVVARAGGGFERRSLSY